MKYSTTKSEFQKSIAKYLLPHAMDYQFFIADLMETLEKKGKVSIIPHSPYGNAFTKELVDTDINEINGTISLTFFLSDSTEFSFVINPLETNQPAPKKYHVNDAKTSQQLNITFIY